LGNPALRTPGPVSNPSPSANVMTPLGRPAFSFRMPAVEELVRQYHVGASAISGRPLTRREIEFASRIFHHSVDYSRVRLLETGIANYVTVCNTIRVPPDFGIADGYMAQTLIHELTHVWQYQRGGSGYMSKALHDQARGTIATGTRDGGYAYNINQYRSFFDFGPEQQGLIVENYYTMIRDQAAIADPSNRGTRYWSNHLSADGSGRTMSSAERMTEINTEMSTHRRFVDQLRATRPHAETHLRTDPLEYMIMPRVSPFAGPGDSGSQYIFRPLIRIDF